MYTRPVLDFTSDTIPVRPGEELDLAALRAYLRPHLPGSLEDLRVRQFAGGHSNLTYQLCAGPQQEYVLRRAPLGPVAPKAHDMAREFAILSAVAPLFPPAPRPIFLCTDPAVIGSIFFLMERRRGNILRSTVPPEIADRVSRAFVECFASLHSIPADHPSLAALGKPQGYLERQVRGWIERWQRARTEEVPDVDRITQWLASRLPPSPRPSLIHNDFKLDNLILDPSDPDRVVAVLDWEMATIGDPLADLGTTLCYWCEAGQFAFTTGPGWFTRDQILEGYSRRTGLDVSDIGYYEVFGIFKLIVILQQIYFRYVRGQTRDERFRSFDREVRALAARGLQKLR